MENLNDVPPVATHTLEPQYEITYSNIAEQMCP